MAIEQDYAAALSAAKSRLTGDEAELFGGQSASAARREQHRATAARLAPKIKIWMEEIALEKAVEVAPIGQLVVLDYNAHVDGGRVKTGAEAFFIPAAGENDNAVEYQYTRWLARYRRNVTEFSHIQIRRRHWDPSDLDHSTAFVRSTARLKIFVAGDGSVGVFSECEPTFEEIAEYAPDLSRSPRQRSQIAEWQAPGTFTRERLREHFLRFLTWVLRDADCLTPRRL